MSTDKIVITSHAMENIRQRCGVSAHIHDRVLKESIVAAVTNVDCRLQPLTPRGENGHKFITKLMPTTTNGLREPAYIVIKEGQLPPLNPLSQGI